MTSPKINNETYINRELSWIDFNKRVLELAIEEETPLPVSYTHLTLPTKA